MKKIIPFKHDIKFDNNLYEITSISLEHNLHKEDNSITGSFIISGDYRITDTSTNIVPFNYDLPFTIDIDEKYDINNAIIDIDDFYYEIIDNKYLSVNIEVKIDKIEEILIPELVSEENEEIEEDTYMNNEDIKLRCIEEEEEQEIIKDDIPSIFNNIGVTENYVNYRVYIVRENDTLDSIMNIYQVTKEELESYNDISNIKIGDKIIIPYVKNQ